MLSLKPLSLLTLLLFYPFILLGQGCNPAIPATTSYLSDQMNGTVSDPKTALIWKKCSEGQRWDTNTNSCTGSASTYTWQTALQQADSINQGIQAENLGYTDWRLPNIKELASLIELQCWAPSINLNYFPETASSFYGSSSSALLSNNLWSVVHLGSGNSTQIDKNFSSYVRLVRKRQ